MTAPEARVTLLRRAGLPGKVRMTPIDFVGGDAKHGPRLVRVDQKKGRHGKERRVRVSIFWLRTKAPEVWAALVAERLMGVEQSTVTGRFSSPTRALQNITPVERGI